MNLQNNPYTLPLVVAGLMAVGLAVFIWQRRVNRAAMPYFVMILGMAIWAFANAAQKATVEQEFKFVWACTAYLGIVVVPGMWLVFSLEYAGLTPRNRRIYWWLAIEPVLVVASVATNGLHGLHYNSVGMVTMDSNTHLMLDHGPLFWAHTGYSYVVLLVGSLIHVRLLLKSTREERLPVAVALFGVASPWIANVIYVTGHSPFPYLDLTPFAFIVGGCAISWSMFRFRFLDIVPVARELIIEDMSAAVIVLDAQDRIAYLNPASGVLFTSALPGQMFRSAIPDLADVLDPGASDRSEIDLGTNPIRTFHVDASRLMSKSNEVTGWLIVLHDITERKQIERELLQTKEEAETANRAKSTFLANMSHEIRTPLNAIIGYAQILEKDRQLGEKQLSSLQAIEKSGDHLLTLINDILDLSKIEAGHQELSPSDFDLAAMLDGISGMFAYRCEQAGLEWTLDAMLENPRVHGDENRIGQVLINLLGNATKFTAKGSVTLSVREVSGKFRFEVSDTGPGIPADKLESVFDPFHQEQSGKVTGGTGLGLSISRGHVEMMGGCLQVSSLEGQGSSFSFELVLPRARQSEATENRERWSRVQRLDEGFAVRALVVDDVEENRDVLLHMLEGVGVTVDLAEDGMAAVEIARSCVPDIVFMDIRMPGIDGVETRRRLVQMHGDDRFCAVAVTASAFTHQRKQYLDAGFDGFIGKPFKQEQIYSCLETLLGVRFVFSAAPEPVEEEVFDFSSIELPPDAHKLLKDAIAIHSITQLRSQLDSLESAGGQSQKLVRHLRPLVQKFDLKAVSKAFDQVSVG
jgi:signal transduction histidine kinase/CheY-like chemotaxis protein